MQTTSQTWKELWASGAARLEARATIAGAEYTDFPTPPVITRAAMQGGLSVGNVASAMCAIALRSGASIPKSAGVRVDMRLTDGDTVSEWLPAGTFFISRRARDPLTGVLALECYDALLKANAVWTPSEGDWPRSAAEVVTELAAQLGVEIDSRTALDEGCVVREPAAGTTIRQVLGQIAQYCGGNWVLTPANRLRLVPLDNAGDGVEVEAVLGQIDAGEAGEITGVRCDVDGTRTISGDDSGVVIDVDLAPVEAADLAERLVGTACRPFALQRAVYDPAAELGDGLTYGGTALGTLWSETATLGPAFRGDVAAPTPAELADEYPYIGGAGKTLALAKAYANRVVAELDDDLTQQEIFNRLTGDGAAQGLVLVNGQLYMNASYIHSGTLTLGGLNNQSGILRLLDAAGGELGRMDNKGLEITNGVIASYAEDRQSRVMLYDGSFGYQEWGTGADGLDGWQDRLVLDGDNGTPTIFGYTGLLIRSKEGNITLRNKYPPYLTGGTIEMEHDTGKIFMRAASDTMMDASMTLYDGKVVIGDSKYAPDCDLKVIGDAYANNFRGALIGNVTGHASSDLALSGGTMTGKITFNKVNNAIAYTGTKASYDMIKFLDNTSDTSGNGISIGGGGAVVIGGGESGNTAAAQVSGGSEILYLCNDGDVNIFSNMQNGWASRKTFTFGANGTLTAPAFSGPLTGNVTGNCSGSSGSCTGNAATATRANSASSLWTRTSLTKGTNPSSTQWTGPTIYTYQTGSGTAVTDRIAGCVESYIDANGLSALCLRAYRFASGQSTQNTLEVRCAKDGTASYSVTNQGAFRNAIGASSGTWPIGVGGTGATTATGAIQNLYGTSYTSQRDAWAKTGIASKNVVAKTDTAGNISLGIDSNNYTIISILENGKQSYSVIAIPYVPDGSTTYYAHCIKSANTANAVVASVNVDLSIIYIPVHANNTAVNA